MAEVDPEIGVFEGDDSYFGGFRKGKRGRGAADKVCVFGILKRGGRVYALSVADASSKTLLTDLKTRVKVDLVVYTDSLSSYNTLEVSGFKPHRVNHSKHFVESRTNPISGIANFWNQSKRVLRNYNGTPGQQLKSLRLWLNL